jgi:DnaJ-class molecular chaperone
MSRIKVERIQGKPCRTCGGTERLITSNRCAACKHAMDIKHNAKKMEQYYLSKVMKRHDVE